MDIAGVSMAISKYNVQSSAKTAVVKKVMESEENLIDSIMKGSDKAFKNLRHKAQPWLGSKFDQMI